MKRVKSIVLAVVLLTSACLAFAAKEMLPKGVGAKSTRMEAKSDLRAMRPAVMSAALAEAQTTIPVIADARLEGPQGNSNYGGSTDLVVKQTNASSDTYNRMSIFKFNLGGIDVNKGRIIKAELQLFVKSNYDAMNSTTKRQNFDDTPYIIALSREDSWEESTVTWNNYTPSAKAAPEIARVMGNTIPYTSTGANNWAIVPNQKVVWDITGDLRRDYLKDDSKQLSLVLTSTSVAANMGITFHSKENGNPDYAPRLVITQESGLPFILPEDTAPTVYEQLLSNISTVLYDEAGSYATVSSSAQGYLDDIRADGSWPGLVYTGDVPTAHLDRLKTMALAYTNNQSSLYGNIALHTAIVNGIQWWYTQNPNHSNWFYDQIAYPQRMGEVLVLMRNGMLKIPVTLELNTLSRMKSLGGAPDQGGSQGTGANKMNIAMHWIYRGCLVEDKAVVDKGVQQVFYPLSLTTGEGLQNDYSYLQHGQQLYIGGYGWDIVNVATRVALYTIETPYAEANADLDNLGIFLRQAYLRVIRGQNFMFNAFGRGIARVNGVSQAGFGGLLKRMKVVEPAYATVYDAAMSRLNKSQPPSYGVEAKHTHFYRADYTLQTKPDYTFELRTVSTRTLRNENGNGENLEGYFLSDGATSIAVTGTEYYNIFPTWDWSMVPGTTTRRGTMVRPGQWGTAGNTTFVGGVSDTTRGVSVYDLDNNSTKAKKAYFFFDDEVVCLGAGIGTTGGTQEVVTTLNQSLLQSDVITSTTGGLVTTYSGNNRDLSFNDNLKWVIQGNIGYVLPSGGEVGLTAKPQTGKWSTITTGASSADVTADVFKLWMKHGVSPENGKYAYIVVPNIQTTAQMQSYTAKENIQVMRNEASVQAVKHKGLGLHSFVFHSAASHFTNDTLAIEVSNPCLLMIQPLEKGKLRLHVADPTKTLSKVTVKVTWPGFLGAQEVTINLPTADELAGKSVVSYLVDDHPDLLVLAAADDFSGTAIAVGASTESVIANDRYREGAIVIGTVPGAVTLSSPNVPSELEFNAATGTIKAKANAPSGTYTFDYNICINGASADKCASAEVTVRVSNAVVAAPDDFSDTPVVGGESTASVLANDTYNGGAIGIGTTPGTLVLSSSNVPNELLFNTTTGVITAKSDAPIGSYSFDYSICENGANPANCKTARVTVRVPNQGVTASNDDFSATPVIAGGSTGSVLDNDTHNEREVAVGTTPGTVALSSENVPNELLFNTTTGIVTAKPDAPSGDYTFNYSICVNGAGSSGCETAEVKIRVRNVLQAVDDNFNSLLTTEVTYTGSVLSNDTFNGGTLPAEVFTLAVVEPATAIQAGRVPELDIQTGKIRVDNQTPVGRYKITYQLCEVGASSPNCTAASVTIEVYREPPALSAPNIFTPNGDAKNAYFQVAGVEAYDRIELTILNRWGDQVYTNKDYDNRWNGGDLPGGTYLYHVRATKGKETKIIKGYTTIIRY